MLCDFRRIVLFLALCATNGCESRPTLKPLVCIEGPNIALGSLSPGTTKSVQVHLRNNSVQTIHLAPELQRSCGCMSAELSHTMLHPGGKCTITANLSVPFANVTAQTVSCIVRPKDESIGPVILRFQYDVVLPWTVYPQEVRLRGSKGSLIDNP